MKKHLNTIKRIFYVLTFVIFVFFSPFKSAIFSWDFPKNFVLNLFVQEDANLIPPLITMPLTELSEVISGRRSQSNAEISFFVNDKMNAKLKGVADDTGKFFIPLGDKKLKPGDTVWVSQCKNGMSSKLSPAYSVIETKLLSWYLEKEKEIIASLKNSTNVLLSWSVLIIGGFIYLTIKEGKNLELLFLLIPTIFLFILSIYFGFSCVAAINSALSNAIKVSSYPLIDALWWNQVQSFQQGIFLSAIIVLWNVPKTQE